ncbi:MAG: hypothetical protein LDL31_09215 [Prosthecobacter sp.]|nr:hypothetical protein [Prosthecobacter sp.]
MPHEENKLRDIAVTYRAATLPSTELLSGQFRALLNAGLQLGLSLSRVSALLAEVIREKLPLEVAEGYATADEGLTTLLGAEGGCVGVEKARQLFRRPQPVTRQALAHQIRQGNVLAYRSGGGDYLVPVWQFRPEGGCWHGLPEVLAAIRAHLGEGPLTAFAFLLQAHPLTGGRPPLEALRAGRLEEVLAAVEADAR